MFNPSATVAGLSEYLWKLEQPAHAVANGYFVGAINRPGWEEPWRIGEFYGQSYFCDPRGKILAEGSREHRRHRHRRSRSRPDPRGAQHLAVLSRPPAGDLRGDHGFVGQAFEPDKRDSALTSAVNLFEQSSHRARQIPVALGLFHRSDKHPSDSPDDESQRAREEDAEQRALVGTGRENHRTDESDEK